MELKVMIGRYHATVTWGKVHSYSDAGGVHREEWEITCTGTTAMEAIQAAMVVAFAKTSKEKAHV